MILRRAIEVGLLSQLMPADLLLALRQLDAWKPASSKGGPDQEAPKAFPIHSQAFQKIGGSLPEVPSLSHDSRFAWLLGARHGLSILSEDPSSSLEALISAAEEL